MGIKLNDGPHQITRTSLTPAVPGAPVPFTYPADVRVAGTFIEDETGTWLWNEELGCYTRPNPVWIDIGGQFVQVMMFDLWTFNADGTYDRASCRGGVERGNFAPNP